MPNDNAIEHNTLIVDLIGDSMRESIVDGFYHEALASLKLISDDSPDVGRAVYWNMIGFLQECYDEIYNDLPERKILLFVPENLRTNPEDEES
jgi:hypothetical protein